MHAAAILVQKSVQSNSIVAYTCCSQGHLVHPFETIYDASSQKVSKTMIQNIVLCNSVHLGLWYYDCQLHMG